MQNLIKQVVLLDRTGEIIGNFLKKHDVKSDKPGFFPVVVDYYLWDMDKQAKSAELFKDKIKRVFDPDRVDKKTKKMLNDDVQRLKVIQTFDYGKEVLETGCSDGTVCIKIAQLPGTKRVVGVDIRQSAIKDAKDLIRELLAKNEIGQKEVGKLHFHNYAIEDLPESFGKFDSVCAYEVFEHMTPSDMLDAFGYLYQFIKKGGSMFVSVPNRFPHIKYEELGRSRWKWLDHRNFFSKLSLEIFLSSFFNKVKFYPLYPQDKVQESIYFICKCNGKKYDV